MKSADCCLFICFHGNVSDLHAWNDSEYCVTPCDVNNVRLPSNWYFGMLGVIGMKVPKNSIRFFGGATVPPRRKTYDLFYRIFPCPASARSGRLVTGL